MEPIAKLREIYEWLSDEESKEIFRLRMEYLLTGDYHLIERITKKYLSTLTTSPNYSVAEVLDRAADRDIICYGAGGDASFYEYYWKELASKKIIVFCDRNIELQNTGFLGYKVISPEQLEVEYSDAFVLISSTIYGEEIKDILLADGFANEQILTGLFPRLMTMLNQYFDMDIIKFSDDTPEVYVDGGSLDLSSVLMLSSFTKVKKAYAFEPNRNHFQQCKQIADQSGLDIELYPFGLWSEKSELRFNERSDGGSHLSASGDSKIEVCSLEDIVTPNEKITFIKMDVEGAELEALRGCRNIIKRDRPKLAICIYHKLEDMYEIPAYIKDLIPEYRLFIRHYSNREFETVLYAVI